MDNVENNNVEHEFESKYQMLWNENPPVVSGDFTLEYPEHAPEDELAAEPIVEPEPSKTEESVEVPEHSVLAPIIVLSLAEVLNETDLHGLVDKLNANTAFTKTISVPSDLDYAVAMFAQDGTSKWSITQSGKELVDRFHEVYKRRREEGK